MANDLKTLAKTYKDNLETILVMMIKKKPSDSITSQILEELKKINSRLSNVEKNQTNDHKLLLSVIKLNNLRTK